MNAVLTGPWEGFLAWAGLITAIATAVMVLVRIIGVFSRSFSDLMATLEDDNVKLRDALSSAEQSRTDLANQLVLVQQKIAETVQTNSALVTRLQNELNDITYPVTSFTLSRIAPRSPTTTGAPLRHAALAPEPSSSSARCSAQ